MGTTNDYRRYVEDAALQFEQVGMSRSAGRILGWLLIADPPHQSMNALVDALQISKSSVSAATQFLIRHDLIQRISLPGERPDYYRVTEGVWPNMMHQQINQMILLRKLAEQGLDLLADQPVVRRERLQEMDDFYAFFEKELPLLIERWKVERSNGLKE
ncbi:MAG: MarR family transcriptional regulator [Anaerolineae bacterium]|nr:MarR family transcriptional regulator [Anaerolineae bacterium]